MKEWLLQNVKELKESDIQWIQSLGCDIRIEKIEPTTIDSLNGRTYAFYSRQPMITITTDNQQQETGLRLKFGKNILKVLEDIPFEGI
jgi:hypothetical protein